MASIIKADTLQSTTANVFILNSSGTEYARFDSSGVFQLANPTTFPAGTAAAPSITATGDTNTGLYFPAADTIAFSEGGVEAMRIDSSGNVGIGTSSPATQLHVSGTNAVLNITRSTKNFYLNPNYANGGSYATFESDLALATVVNGAERMRIDTSGNLLFNSGYGSVATAYGCRAWVNFNGTGIVAIRASGNVTSVTDDGVGKYTVNFTTAMTDANYAAITGFTTPAWTSVTHAFTYLTSSVKVECANGTTPTFADPTVFTVAIFR